MQGRGKGSQALHLVWKTLSDEMVLQVPQSTVLDELHILTQVYEVL
jgi:hypothetical protein